jgi:hypothetical protein
VRRFIETLRGIWNRPGSGHVTRAVLHIGTEKTGTTALQAYLQRNRDALMRRGIMYSAAAGWQNHYRLAAFACKDAVDDLRLICGVQTLQDLPAFRRKLKADLAAEVRRHSDKLFLFSNEHCHSRVVHDDEMARLKELLAGLFQEVRVILYLRRQDEVATSLYSTSLKAGSTDRSVIGERMASSRYFDYGQLIERWTEAFGEENVTVARFSAIHLLNGSIIEDFCQRLGLPVLDHAAERENQSLKPEYQEFLRQMNQFLPRFADGRLNVRRGPLEQALEAVGSGSGRQPTRSEALAFYRRFDAINEKVRARYFPDSPTLFEEDFSRYPETEEAANLTQEDTIRIAAEIWGHLSEWAARQGAAA